MLRIAFKLVAFGVVLFLAYKAAYAYALFQFADHMRECLPASGVCRMVEVNAADPKIGRAMGEALSCAKQKQGAVESVFLHVPKHESTGGISSSDSKGLSEMCRVWGKPSTTAKK